MRVHRPDEAAVKAIESTEGHIMQQFLGDVEVFEAPAPATA
ncbi:MAG: hypothetical protein WD770_01180 [Actinomycetota bacterium]